MGKILGKAIFTPQGCEKNVFKTCIWYEIL